jgi:predicted branched-subunit amino acid permease
MPPEGEKRNPMDGVSAAQREALNAQVQGKTGFAAHAGQLRAGLRDGMPIALGYLAVSFTLGIAARNAGLTAFQAMLASALNNASAGEYAGFTLIAAGAGLAEVAIMTLVANARYLLMSCALSQHLSADTPLWQRLVVGFDVTDEIFGISIARPGMLDPWYTIGAILVALPGWAGGTFFGVVAGNVLPLRIVSALSVALYGMFLAVIIPPARKNRVVAGLVALSFAASFAAGKLPGLSQLSSGMRTIVLTVAISLLAAILFPVKEDSEDAA